MVTCHKCEKEVDSKDDLVVVPKGIRIVTYHVNCYDYDRKLLKSYFLGRQPLNGNTSNSITYALIGLSLVLALNGGFLLSLIVLIYPAVRFYVYYAYEKQFA